VTDTARRFGDCEFDEASGSLRVAGRPVEIDRPCRAILAVLLDNAGTDVGKQRLLAAGWPDRTVQENSLAQAIARLRRMLGTQGDKLQTIYGIGYKLDVAVRASGSTGGGTVAAAPTPPPGAGVPRRALVLGAIALAGLAAIAAAYLLDPSRSGAEDQFRATPPIIGDAPDAIGKVLWVDDHPQNNALEKRLFEERRIAVHPVESSTDALRLLAMYDYDVVISDMGRGDDRLAGVRLVEAMRKSGDDTPFVIYTIRPDGEEQQRAQRRMVAAAGAQGVAVTPEEIRSTILRRFGNPAKRP